jgi:hypothetical protein
MKLALRYIGPIAVGINGNTPEFLAYKGGIFDSPTCKQKANHALLITGYGEEMDATGTFVKYWIARNRYAKLANFYCLCYTIPMLNYLAHFTQLGNRMGRKRRFCTYQKRTRTFWYPRSLWHCSKPKCRTCGRTSSGNGVCIQRKWTWDQMEWLWYRQFLCRYWV